MSQRYQQSSYHQPDNRSTSYNLPSYVSAASISPRLSTSHPTGLGLSFYTTTMAMPQTQSPGPIHGLSYCQRPFWDSSSTLMLDTNPGAAGMERGKSWEEAYDPFALFPPTGPSASDPYLLSTPMSHSEGYPRFSETSSRIATHSLPPSQTGSFSSASYPPSESLFPQPDVKLEDPLDWTNSSQPDFSAPRPSMEPEYFVLPGSVYDPQRIVHSPAPVESQYPPHAAPTLGKHRREGSVTSRHPSHITSDEKKRLGYKRKRTPRENANWICEICDMPFERSYNLKSHLETHDPDRQKPFKCEYEGCSREFVRKTDLTRHVQSVHIKSKDWVCSLCEQAFARKDTLRRHEEDGCSKRFDLKPRESHQKSVSKSPAHSSPLSRRRSLTADAATRGPQLSIPPFAAHSPKRDKYR